jgi:O-antigen ligase
MNAYPEQSFVGSSKPTAAIAVCFALFLFSSAFSIAAAQIALGLCLALSLWPSLEPWRATAQGLRLVYLAWGGHLGWLIISSLVNDNPLRSLSAIREEWLIVILPLGVYLHGRADWSRRLVVVLACGLLLASVHGVIQHFTGWTWSAAQPHHHPLTYGYYVVTATVFMLTYLALSYRSLGRWSRLLLIAATVGGLAASALCNSRGPLLALAIGLVAAGCLLGKWRWVVSVLVALGLLMVAVAPEYPRVFVQRVQNDLALANPDGRLFIWTNALRIAEDSPVFGCGPGNFGEAYAEQNISAANIRGQSHAHNDFLNQAATGGVPGLALYLLFWIVVVARLWRTRSRGGSAEATALASGALVASAAFLTGSMTEAAIADEELRQILFALWAAGLSVGQPSATRT